jgi:hypothetical protein
MSILLVDEALEHGSQAIDEYLLMLVLAYVAEARCHLELGESDTALFRLQEGTERIRERISQYLRLLLTSNPAAYLDSSLKNEIGLSKLTQIYQWLDPTLNEVAVFEMQRENLFNLAEEQSAKSGYQWGKSLPAAIIQETEVQGRGWGNQEEIKAEAMNRLPQTFKAMESMIETYERLESYQVEVKTLSRIGRTFEEWKQLTPVSGSQPEGATLMVLVPAEPVVI